MDLGTATVVQCIVPLDQQAATVSFYDDWVASQDTAYNRTESEGGGITWQGVEPDGGSQTIIALLSILDGDDFVAGTLTVGQLE